MSSIIALIVIIVSSHLSFAQLPIIDGVQYITLSDMYGADNIVAIENRSSMEDGTITIVEKNLCPQNYKGGTLYRITGSNGFLRTAAIINNEIHVPFLASGFVPGVNYQISGSPISTFGPPFPEFGSTVTISNLYSQSVYAYSMTCYYNNGCPGEGPNVGACSWNSPYYFVAINMSSSFDLSVGNVTIDTEVAADNKYKLAPESQYQINVPVSGEGISPNESRELTIHLQIGSQGVQQTIPLSSLISEQVIVPFHVTLPIDDVGDQTLQVVLDPSNTLNESNRQNNISSQLTHVLCNVQKNGIVVPWFYQSQQPWGEKVYANQAPDKMKDYACMTTALAMLYNFYGIDTAPNGSNMDPDSVNEGLKSTLFYPELGPDYASYNGYTPSGGVQPNGAVSFARNSYFMKCIQTNSDLSSCLEQSKSSISFKKSVNSFSETSQQLVNSELCKGNPVILRVPSISSPTDLTKSHFVLATGMDVDRFGSKRYIVNNPGISGGRDSALELGQVRGFRLYQPTYDPSMVFFHLSGDVDMIITDPQGNRSGYNPQTQVHYSEIPGGTYFEAESIGSPFDASISTPPEVRFEGMEPLMGEYQIQIFAKSNTDYRLTQYSFDTTGTINGINNASGTLLVNENITQAFNHSDESVLIDIANLNIDRASFIDKKHKDMAFISGKIKKSDNQSIGSIEKYLVVKLGNFSKIIEVKQLKKIKILGKTSYMYGSFGKNKLFININTNTNEFQIFIGNAQLDTGDTSISKDFMLQIDDMIAKGLVEFKNIRKKKINAKK